MTNEETTILVDAHVHLHPGVRLPAALTYARRNFERAAHGLGSASWLGVLCLADMNGADSLQQVPAGGPGEGDDWGLEPTSDGAAIVAKAGCATIVLLSGQQIATREGLEVLALGTRERVPDRLTLDESVAAAHDAAPIVVLPWAVGKWLGRRGRLIAQQVDRGRDTLFVGDNGGRPWCWPTPAVLAGARRNRRPVLSGSDPLPLPGEESRIGSRGIHLQGRLALRRPAAELAAVLKSCPSGVQQFGRQESLPAFMRNQTLLRLRARAIRRKD